MALFTFGKIKKEKKNKNETLKESIITIEIKIWNRMLSWISKEEVLLRVIIFIFFLISALIKIMV
jgi:hypothetical protein